MKKGSDWEKEVKWDQEYTVNEEEDKRKKNEEKEMRKIYNEGK